MNALTLWRYPHLTNDLLTKTDMKNFKTIIMTLALGTSLQALAQTASEQKSVICNNDGTVTFRYTNPTAKEVQVDVQFAKKTPMQRDANGVWTATLGPASPDMYPYHFEVDGVSVMDPLCPQYFPNEGFKNSLLEIPDPKGALAHDIQDVPHGKVSTSTTIPRAFRAPTTPLSICLQLTIRKAMRTRNTQFSTSSAAQPTRKRFITRWDA